MHIVQGHRAGTVCLFLPVVAFGVETLTQGRMAEAVIECSGAAPAIRSALDYVSYAGHIALVGWPKAEIPLPTAFFTKKELTVRGSRNSVGQFPESLRLIAEGKIYCFLFGHLILQRFCSVLQL